MITFMTAAGKGGKNKKNMALQVQSRHIRPYPYCPAIRDRTPFFRRTVPGVRGSLTLEASLAVPLFLFAVYLLLLPLKMLDTSRRMQEICEELCKSAAEAAYVRNLSHAVSGEDPGGGAEVLPGTGPSGRDAIDQEGGGGNPEAADREAERSARTQESFSLLSSLSGNALGLLAISRVRSEIADPNVLHLSALGSSCLADGETIVLKLDYDYDLPFPMFGLGTFRQSVTARRRAWIGRSQSGESGSYEDSSESSTVYVGASSTRYHKDPRCHYLSNDLTALSYADLDSARSSDGSRYRPCTRCAKGTAGGTVYIMPSGRSFHTDPACTAIIAYARAVPLCEAEHLGPCSYCCGGS